MAAVNEDTKSMIDDQVKKGKARKFFLIVKGSTIQTLVVFKKGAFGPKIMAAKKEGFKGEVAYGVVTGSGKNLFFQLPGSGEVAAAMKVDSWSEKPPTKRAKLREFLAGEGLNYKPSYHIITDVANAPNPEVESDVPLAPPPPGSEPGDEDEPDSAAAGAAAEQVTTAQASEQPAASSSSAADGSAQFLARLAKVKPDLDRIVAARVGISLDVKLGLSEAGVFARKGDFASANQVLDRLEQLSQSPSAEAAKSPVKRIQAMSPALKQVLTDKIGDYAEIGGLVKEAQAQAATDADFAHEVLSACETLLDMATVPAAARLDSDAWRKACAAWEDAVHTVNGQLEKLQAELRKSDDKELHHIAEFGINGVTGNFRVPLMAAIHEIQSNPEEVSGGTISKALALIHDFKTYLSGDPKPEACDRNPFGVQVTVREQYGKALDELGAVLKSAGKI